MLCNIFIINYKYITNNYFLSILWRRVFFTSTGTTSPSRIRTISSIPRIQIMINPYLYPWWELMNEEIWPPKFTIKMRSIKIVTMSIRPCFFAHSVNADWSGLRYLVWSHANPDTITISMRVNIVDSGTPNTVGSITFVNHFSSISKAVKRMTKSHTHWIEGYSPSFLAI